MDINILNSLKTDSTSLVSFLPQDIINHTKPYLEYNFLESKIENLQKKSEDLSKELDPLEKEYMGINNEYNRLKKICNNLQYQMHSKENMLWEIKKKKENMNKEELSINQEKKNLEIIQKAIMFKNTHLPKNYHILTYNDLEELTDDQLMAYVIHRDIQNVNQNYLTCSTMICKLFMNEHYPSHLQSSLKSRKNLLEYIEFLRCSICGGLDHSVEYCLDIDAFNES